jgi:hypothetical protein
MKCGIKCPYWKFSLKYPTGLGPICTKYMLSLDAARDKCFSAVKHGKARKRKRIRFSETIAAKPWPGINKGYGALTEVRNDIL